MQRYFTERYGWLVIFPQDYIFSELEKTFLFNRFKFW
jgi:hypothetical protein